MSRIMVRKYAIVISYLWRITVFLFTFALRLFGVLYGGYLSF